MACLSSIHHALARLQAASVSSSPSPLPLELIIGPLRRPFERRIQAYSTQFKRLPASTSLHSALRSTLVVFATAAETETATSSLVLQEVDFVWKGEGSQVLLTGDFLGWETKVSLTKGADGAFHFKQKLSPGTYMYKYIIDGKWAYSPDLPMIEDGQGGFNNQITVTDVPSSSPNLKTSKNPAEGASLAANAKGTTDSGVTVEASKATPKATVEDSGATVEASPPKAAPVEASPPKVEVSPPKAAPKATVEASPPKEAPVEASPPKAAPKATVEDSGATVETSPPKAAPKATRAARPAKKASVDKPYPQLIIEDVVPKIKSNLQKEKDISDVDVVFQDNQLEGSFVKNGIIYTFWAFFPDGKLEGSRGFSLSSHGAPPSTVEPFLIDEKKISAELLVFWVMKRLFAQKLLSLN